MSSIQGSPLPNITLPVLPSLSPSTAAAVVPTSNTMNKVLSELFTSGLSVGLANTITNPLDVVKVRMQLQRKATAGAAGHSSSGSGLVRTGITVVQNEGLLALWSGIGPSIARGFFFGGARLGLYSPIKGLVSEGIGASPNSFELKVLSGSLSGGLAAAVTSPIELINTRLQAAGASTSVSAGAGAKPMNTSMGVIRSVIAADGVAGLWKGAMPGLYRSAILTACQCATYDECKRVVMGATGWGNSIETHLVSSMIAGLVTTTVTAPLDVVKTRMFLSNSPSSTSSSGSSSSAVRYSGRGAMARCAADIMRTEGAAGFFRGWSAAYARLGPHTVIMFLAAERLRKLAGLDGL